MAYVHNRQLNELQLLQDIKNTLSKKRKSVPIQADAFRPKQEEADANKVEDNRTFDLGNERVPTITEEMHEDNTVSCTEVIYKTTFRAFNFLCLLLQDETNLAKEIDGNGTEEAPFIVTADEANGTDDNNKTIAKRLRGQFGRTVKPSYQTQSDFIFYKQNKKNIRAQNSGSANLGLTLKDKITINYILQSEKTKVLANIQDIELSRAHLLPLVTPLDSSSKSKWLNTSVRLFLSILNISYFPIHFYSIFFCNRSLKLTQNS